MYSSIFIYLFIWEPEECSQSAQQVCNGLYNQGPRFNAWQQQDLFSKATRLAPGFWTRPVSHSVGIRTLSQGEKTSEHKADNSPFPLPTLPRSIPQPMSCLQGMYKQHYSIFTPYFYFITWVWNWAATYTQVSLFQSTKWTYTQVSAKYHKHITHSSFMCTWIHMHSIWPKGPQNHAMTIHKVSRIQWAGITYLNDTTVSAETKVSTWETNQLFRLPGRTQVGSLQFGFRIFFLLCMLLYFEWVMEN